MPHALLEPDLIITIVAHPEKEAAKQNPLWKLTLSVVFPKGHTNP